MLRSPSAPSTRTDAAGLPPLAPATPEPALQRCDSFDRMVQARTERPLAAKEPLRGPRLYPRRAHVLPDSRLIQAGPKLFYVTETRLGQGSTSEVYLGIAVGRGELLALKLTDRHENIAYTAAHMAKSGSGLAPNALLATDDDVVEVEPLLTRDLADRAEMDSLDPAARHGLAWLTARAVAPALANLHRHGLAHRDVKPANIMHGSSGLQLIDHNLATYVDSPRYVTTPWYAPPEAEDPRHPRAGMDKLDRWCLGASLMELAGGARAVRLLRLSREDFPTGRWHPAYVSIRAALLAGEPPEALTEPQRVVWNAFESVDPAMRTLILELLHPDPGARLDLEALLRRLESPAVQEACDLEAARSFLRARAERRVDALAPAVQDAVVALRAQSPAIKAALGALPTWLAPDASP